MYYKYWISADQKKVSLMEVYHSNEDAIFHMNAFANAAIEINFRNFRGYKFSGHRKY